MGKDKLNNNTMQEKIKKNNQQTQQLTITLAIIPLCLYAYYTLRAQNRKSE
ncbi:hypothetical protein PIOMA14_I_1552 [Prevotella intermedia]|uniref:Uncharacterized protein n=1 Tax=Prevotella intermedia TaxID=28131 RepID=A0A0S3UKK9_PREIN|nr:hypothetical protein PIOMA14_I_1552 [Prevotella intermedia]